MNYKILSLVVLALIFTGSAFANSPMPAPRDPKEVIDQFCKLDLDGARLRPGDVDPIWTLTIDNAEPPEGQPIVVKSFKIVQESINKYDAYVQVVYDSPGPLHSKYLPEIDTQTPPTTFHLILTNNIWQISLADLNTPPHVSAKAYQSHVREEMSDVERRLAVLKEVDQALDKVK